MNTSIVKLEKLSIVIISLLFSSVSFGMPSLIKKGISLSDNVATFYLSKHDCLSSLNTIEIICKRTKQNSILILTDDESLLSKTQKLTLDKGIKSTLFKNDVLLEKYKGKISSFIVLNQSRQTELFACPLAFIGKYINALPFYFAESIEVRTVDKPATIPYKRNDNVYYAKDSCIYQFNGSIAECKANHPKKDSVERTIKHIRLQEEKGLKKIGYTYDRLKKEFDGYTGNRLVLNSFHYADSQNIYYAYYASYFEPEIVNKDTLINLISDCSIIHADNNGKIKKRYFINDSALVNRKYSYNLTNGFAVNDNKFICYTSTNWIKEAGTRYFIAEGEIIGDNILLSKMDTSAVVPELLRKFEYQMDTYHMTNDEVSFVVFPYHFNLKKHELRKITFPDSIETKLERYDFEKLISSYKELNIPHFNDVLVLNDDYRIILFTQNTNQIYFAYCVNDKVVSISNIGKPIPKDIRYLKFSKECVTLFYGLRNGL